MGKEEPVSLRLTGANVHDSVPVKEMLIPLQGAGIKRFVADRGYDDDKIRDALKAQKIASDIPPRKNRTEGRFYDKTIYYWRWRVEAFFGKIKKTDD